MKLEWSLNRWELVLLSLYSMILPLFIAISKVTNSSEWLPIVGSVITLPFSLMGMFAGWAASISYNSLIVSMLYIWAVIFIQAWFSLVQIHDRINRNNISYRIEFGKLAGRISLIVILSIGAFALWLTSKP